MPEYGLYEIKISIVYSSFVKKKYLKIMAMTQNTKENSKIIYLSIIQNFIIQQNSYVTPKKFHLKEECGLTCRNSYHNNIDAY